MPFKLKQPRLPRLSENDVERACIDLLHVRGYFVIRIHCGTFKTVDGRRWVKGAEPGTPDYAALHARWPGFLLEVKRPGETPSPAQKFMHLRLQQGFSLPVAVVDCVEALAAWIKEHEQPQ